MVSGVAAGSCRDPSGRVCRAVVAGVVFVVIHYLLAGPPVVDYTSEAKAGQVNVVMQADAQNTVSDTPDWVSYFVKNPQTGQWDHTTLLKLPANTAGEHDDSRL